MKTQYKLIILGILIGALLICPLSSIIYTEKKSGLIIKESEIKPSDTSKKIVAANTIIQDIVESIVGKKIDVVVSGAEDPHSYEPSSSEVEALEDADVIFRLGLEEVEPWWESEWDEGAEVVGLVDVNMLKVDPLLEVKNPHVWMDPNNIKNFTRQINRTMVREDPDNENAFSTNTKGYIDKLNELLADDISDAKNGLKGTKVIVNHPAFYYFFELLEIERLATIEKGEGKEPSAEDIGELIDLANEKNVDLVVTDPQHQSENVYEVARETNLKIGILTPLLNVEVEWDGETKLIDTYEKMITYNPWALQNPSDPPALMWPLYVILGIVIAGVIGVFIHIRRR